MSATGIAVGDKVRKRQGRVVWTVDRVDGVRVWMHSERSKQRALVANVILVERATPDRATPDLVFKDDGSVQLGDEVICASDSVVDTVVEWSTPVYAGIDPNEPSSVGFCIEHDRDDQLWLQIEAHGPDGNDSGRAALTKRSVEDLAVKLLQAAARM